MVSFRKILVLMNKRIVCQGTPDNMLSNTRTEDVARFFGFNMLRGRIVSIKIESSLISMVNILH